jgi:hypothetical protein
MVDKNPAKISFENTAAASSPVHPERGWSRNGKSGVESEGILHRPAHPAIHPQTAEAVTANSPASAPCPDRRPNRFSNMV